jgi:hypothetical protein
MDRGQAMHPKILPIFVGALAVTLVLLVYALYKQQQQLDALAIVVGEGISIEKK